MSRNESKSTGAARKNIQETGVAHSRAHFSMSTRKNEPKTAHIAENGSRRKFSVHGGALSTANKSPRCENSPRSVQLTMVKAVKRLRRRRKREKNKEIRGVRR